MIRQSDVMKLIEANRLMSEVIDSLYSRLSQHESVEETEASGDLEKIHVAADIMKDYE